MASLSDLQFVSPFASSLPPDPLRLDEPREVKGACFSFVRPTPVTSCTLELWNEPLGNMLGLEVPERQSTTADLLGGNRLPEGQEPFAAVYGGHQFGNWAGQLGDGRAMSLGSIPDSKGKLWELQLKGAGRTPYSRRGDGRAVLRSSIREYLCSEAMAGLGIPTTRALSLVTTGEDVIRDFFYDGNPMPEPGAIVCRVAPSFIRFGNFQILASRGELEILRRLVQFTIHHFYPDCFVNNDERLSCASFFQKVCERTADLMVHWMSVGFVHGVMNTDNFSILGDTIDYGPYGWLDSYDSAWTPNTTDLPGRRYAFGRQPNVALWNLARLGEALLPLMGGEKKELEKALESYGARFQESFLQKFGRKLGFASLVREEEIELWRKLESLMSKTETDYTLLFRSLAQAAEARDLHHWFLAQDFFYSPLSEERAREWLAWLEEWKNLLRLRGGSIDEIQSTMNQENPIYVPRNFLIQEAIEQAEKGDFSRAKKLEEVFRNPFTEQRGAEFCAAKRPAWALQKAGCSQLSCSS